MIHLIIIAAPSSNQNMTDPNYTINIKGSLHPQKTIIGTLRQPSKLCFDIV